MTEAPLSPADDASAAPASPPVAPAQRAIWSSLGARERLLAVATGVLLVSVLVDRLVVHPWGAHVRQIRQETQAMERTVTKQGQFLERKDYVLAEAEYYKPFLRTAGPRDLEIASLLKELESLGAQAEVSLGEIKPVPSEAAGPYQTYTFDIQYECALPQWVQWIYLLESSPSLFTIDRATVALKDKVAGTLKGSVRLTRMATSATQTSLAPTTGE